MNSTFLVLAIVTALATPLAAESNAQDEAAIRKVITAYSSARDALDAQAMANLYANDAEYRSLGGEQSITGRSSIEKHWADFFQRKSSRASRRLKHMHF